MQQLKSPLLSLHTYTYHWVRVPHLYGILNNKIPLDVAVRLIHALLIQHEGVDSDAARPRAVSTRACISNTATSRGILLLLVCTVHTRTRHCIYSAACCMYCAYHQQGIVYTVPSPRAGHCIYCALPQALHVHLAVSQYYVYGLYRDL